MPLALNEEQRMLRDTAREFLQNNAPINLMRELRDSGDSKGYSDAVWQQMIELGFPAVAIPESYGGLGFGYLGAGAILEEAGKTLAHSPFYSTVALGAAAITLGGTEEQKHALLAAIAAGELTLAMAHEESNHHQPNTVSLSASASGDDYVLNGKKLFVAEGAIADKLLVSARTQGQNNDKDGITLFLVDRNSEGVSCQTSTMIDSRNYADIEFNNVKASAANIIGTVNQAFSILDKTFDYGRICLAAEMLGGAQTMFDKTVEYLKDREQFGQKIGSFQALQHRAAKMFAELELTRSAVVGALSAIDDDSDNLPMMASLAKTRANDTYRLITDEAVQMHGGIGLTDEMDIGFYLKRCRISIHSLGDSGFHTDRYATLQGF